MPDTALTAWVGKIFGAGVNEGNWARAIPPYGTDQGNSRALASNSRARTVVRTGGQVFTAFYQSVSNDVFVVRSPGDLSSVDKSAALAGNTPTYTSPSPATPNCGFAGRPNTPWTSAITSPAGRAAISVG